VQDDINNPPLIKLQPQPQEESSISALFRAAAQTAVPLGAETAKGAHDAFRYEWGRWVNDDDMKELMARVNEIRLVDGIYDTLVQPNNNSNDIDDTSPTPRRLRVAGGEHWDVILHILPPGSEWNGRWPTGAWAVVRSLTGVAEISMLRGPNRDGYYTKATKKDLRGGGDGTLAGGASGTAGEDSVKYVGGALRCYAGKSGKTALLEVVVRPPIGKGPLDGDGRDSLDMEVLDHPDTTLRVVQPGEEVKKVDYDEEETPSSPDQNPNHLGAKMGMTFDKVGGLDDQLNAIVRRVLASRYEDLPCPAWGFIL
jgi:hypothetical protein